MCDIVTAQEVDEFILKHVTRETWEELGDMVKSRYRNMSRNYLSFPDAQNLMPLPDFITKFSRHSKKIVSESSDKDKDRKTGKRVKQVTKAGSNVPRRRNPKRNVSEVNYLEDDEPGEDRYVFCDNCQEEYLDFCSKCGMLKSLRDFPVPVGTEDRAKKTAPKGVLEVRPSNIHGLGVFATRHVRKGIQMGPYQGQITRVDTANGYCWKLRDGRLIDAADETCSNWMRYVNCARHVDEQNVVAFQYMGELYYRTCRDVSSGEELLVYYGRSFAKNLGIDTKRYFRPNREEVDRDYFCCGYCKVGLSTREYRDTHEKRCRFRFDRTVVGSEGDNFVCRHCGCTVTKEDFLKKHEVRCGKSPKRKSPRDEKKFNCLDCDKKFISKSGLNRHKRIHDESTKMFECEKCPYKTVYSDLLRSHEKTHQNDFRFKCQVCQAGFIWKLHLDSHLLHKHHSLSYLVTSKIHHCEFCAFETVNKTHLESHMISHKKNHNEKFYCNHCTFSSNYKKSLKQHLLKHSLKKKPYLCRMCSKDFARKYELNSHILTNHNENEQLVMSITNKIHYCPFCKYRTIKSSNLKRHVYSQHDKNIIRKTELRTCKECNKNFIEKRSLDSHIMNNHAENTELMASLTSKIHSCPFCSYKSVIKSNLSRHMATHKKN